MPIGLSDGQVFKDEFELLVAHNRPLEASEKPAGALNEEGSYPSSGANSEETKKPLRVVITPKEEKDLSSISVDPNQIGQTDVLSGEDRYQLWPERAVRSWMNNLSTKWEGLKNLMDGKIDPYSDEGRTVVASVAAELGGAGLATAPMRTGVGVFGGMHGSAKVKNLQAAKEAMRLLDEGGSAQDVFQKTGWYRDVRDGYMKFEISDKNARILNTPFPEAGGMRLEKVLDHPELYKAYPELKGLFVYYDDGIPSHSSAYFSPLQFIDGEYREAFIGLSPSVVEGSDKELTKALLHEIQHYIQQKENFAQGSSPDQFISEVINEQLQQDLIAVENFMVAYITKKIPRNEKTEKDFQSARRIIAILPKLLEKAEKHSFERYWKDPGEIEARNVERRFDIENSEMYGLLQNLLQKLGLKGKKLHPHSTEDVVSP